MQGQSVRLTGDAILSGLAAAFESLPNMTANEAAHAAAGNIHSLTEVQAAVDAHAAAPANSQYAKFVEGFRALGLSAAEAAVAARG